MNNLFFLLLSVCWFSSSDAFLPRILSFSRPVREPPSFRMYRKYPLSQTHYERYLRRLNSQNHTIQINEILNEDDNQNKENLSELFYQKFIKEFEGTFVNELGELINNELSNEAEEAEHGSDEDDEDDEDDEHQGFYQDPYGNLIRTFGRSSGSRNSNNPKKSENFEVIFKSPINFTDIGGYTNIKHELDQCIDILSNYTKYAPYNVRVPKGIIFEGPPGNGKTMLAKALAGEAKTAFIPVSGAEFQDKYIGVGSGRIRELFELARKNVPCIIFIDEIDALGRKRSGDGESSGNERDNTLNELLVALDGFKNTSGIFVIGATNRIDLLDPALIRPGRIDKQIYIGNPDRATRTAILNIHLRGKPHDSTVILEDLVEVTNGLSGAQLENLVNEAMLNALRYDRTQFTMLDLDIILNKMLAGWQPNDHQFTPEMIDQIAIHEMGHAIVGILSSHHSKMTKVVINLSAPNSPAYTVFESSASTILTREALFEHLMILLAGRIAEEVFYGGSSVTTGALSDFEEALKLAEKMVRYYGMGKQSIYPSMSEKYKQLIDDEVAGLINDAYGYAEFILRNSKELAKEGAAILKRDRVLKSDTLVDLINTRYPNILGLRIQR